MDSTDKADLMAIQGNYTLHPTLAGLAKQITQKKVNQQLYVNDMIRYYADSDSVDAAVEALLLLSSEANIQTLFSTSIGLNLDETSQEIYNTLSEIETIDPDWMAVQGLLLQLVLNNQTVFDIDSTQHAMLYEIAEKTEASLASANARSILKLVFDEEFEDDIESESRFGTGQIKSEIEVKKINSNQLSLNPNPTINQVTISYNLDESAEMAVFELFDVFGSLIMKKEVPSGKNQFRLQLTELSPGIYLCVIKNNESRFQKKLVITK
ncbi:MAG: T9SS type A sorting domain-containing protein [Bacteroidetes bacterium]|nr:T9SS type A sorting domain-containing protein [Bacteroidota bacterium]